MPLGAMRHAAPIGLHVGGCRRLLGSNHGGHKLVRNSRKAGLPSPPLPPFLIIDLTQFIAIGAQLMWCALGDNHAERYEIGLPHQAWCICMISLFTLVTVGAPQRIRSC